HEHFLLRIKLCRNHPVFMHHLPIASCNRGCMKAPPMFELPQPLEIAFVDAWQPFAWFGPYAPLAMLVIGGFVVLYSSRLGLMLWQRKRISAHRMWLPGLLQGARVDAIQLAQICFVPVLFAPLSAIPALWDVWQGFTAFWIV